MPIRYHDTYLRLLGIPILGFIFRHVGEWGSLVDLLRTPQYYLDLGISCLVLWGLWEYNRWIIKKLDQQYLWLESPFRRMLLQGLLGILVSLLLVLITSFLYNDLLIDRSAPEVTNIVVATDVPVAFLILLIIHLIYALLHIVQVYQTQTTTWPKPDVSPEKSKTQKRSLLAYQGRAQIPVMLEDVAYFFKAGEITFLCTEEKSEHRVDLTLEQLEKSLSAEDFFRLNRQYIAHRRSIRKVIGDGQGRLRVNLAPAPKEEVLVSRKKASDFRHWIEEA